MAARNRLNKPEHPASTPSAQPKAGMLGIGFDAEDGHKRLTRGDNFLLLGGSQETHEVMQETAVKINEKLAQKGKRLEDASPQEIRDIVQDIRR
ncbi:MAG: hypothetical protein QM811_23395 [Pirellulales bacterium]